MLRIFHYSPWYTYWQATLRAPLVENLSLFALIYLCTRGVVLSICWESFIIRLDILKKSCSVMGFSLRIFHYSPWYTYFWVRHLLAGVENLSLFALIYLTSARWRRFWSWESFIIRLDILTPRDQPVRWALRIFHYSPWYTYAKPT